MKRTRKETALLVAIGVVLAAALGVVVFGLLRRSPAKAVPQHVEVPTPSVRVEYVEHETFVEVQKEISAEVIQDGLRDMGVLITGEYWFTEVVDYNSVKTIKTFWNDKAVLPGSESSYIYSYDGTVSAGIDFADITVTKDDAAGRITVRVPKSTIRYVDIDEDSFQPYSEKQSIINPTSVVDYANSRKELETKAQEKALERGLLKRADENAHTVIENFVGSLVDTAVYDIVFITV